MSAISVGGDLVHYEVLGRGRAVVLIHGWIGSWRYWIPTMQQLHLKFRVYAVDLFGFGDSAKNPEKYAVEHQVHLLTEFMQQLGLKKAAMIGHGLGALVMTEFAQRHQDRIARMMIANAPLFDTGDLATRKPPGQSTLLTTRDFSVEKTILKAQEEAASNNQDKTITSRPQLTDATLPSARTINRARLEEAAMARAEAELEKRRQAASLSSSGGDSPGINQPTNGDNPLFRKLGNMEPEALLNRCFKRSEPEFDKLNQDVAKTDGSVISHSTRNFDPGRMLDILRALTVPTVVVHGTDDPLIESPSEDVWNYITMEKDDLLLPVPLSGVRHFPMLEHDSFPRLVNGFLEQQDISKIEVKERWRRRSR